MTILDRPIRSGTTAWLKEMIAMETEEYTDGDVYTASLVSAASPAPLPLPAPPPHATVAEVDSVQRSPRPVRDGEDEAILTPFALAMLGACEVCE